jgi:hypothetical protein
MKNIYARFSAQKLSNPYLSDYANFASAVKGQGFGRDAISRNFDKLVSKGDYGSGDIRVLLDNLTSLSQSTYGHMAVKKNGFRAAQNTQGDMVSPPTQTEAKNSKRSLSANSNFQ